MFGFKKKKPVENLNTEKAKLSVEEAADLLNTSPDALKEFEKAYAYAREREDRNGDIFGIGAGDVIRALPGKEGCSDSLTDRIVNELVADTAVYRYKREEEKAEEIQYLPTAEKPVTKEELEKLPLTVRPQCTGTLTRVDCEANAGLAVLDMYKNWKKTGDGHYYRLFRQGLDILDIDPLIYAMLGRNQNSMEHWLPQLVEAAKDSTFFKIPSTTIVRVPPTLLQLARVDYDLINEATRRIVDEWARKVFELPREPKDTDARFIKTGTYSSKFDFRNALVRGKELNDLGEYLLFIQNQAVMMAGPLIQPSIYGVSTTNTWVCREAVPNKDARFTIYHGLPLHTEYRVFIDCDTDSVLGIVNYWDKDALVKRFSKERDKDTADKKHDLVTFLAEYPAMEKRYEESKGRVVSAMQELLPNLALTGQWSIDVMQNGDDFWLIDMALAENSAFYDKAVPKEMKKPSEENWLPNLSNRKTEPTQGA